MYSIAQKLQASHGDVWAMEKTRFAQLCGYMADYNFDIEPEAMEAAIVAQKARLRRVANSVSVIPIIGAIEHRASFFSFFGMGTSTQLVGEAFDEAINNESVKAVVFDIDTPGGTVDGVPELAAKIFEARGIKPIIAISNSMMASAGLWIGTAADQVQVIPSGDIGSHGVWSLHMDFSKQMEQDGVEATFVFAGEHKVEGNPFEPLSDEAREEMQRRVNGVFDDFSKGLALHRNVTKKVAIATFGGGRTMSAVDAKKVGLVDKIGTLDEILAKFGETSKSVRNQMAEDVEPTIIKTEAGSREIRLRERRLPERS